MYKQKNKVNKILPGDSHEGYYKSRPKSSPADVAFTV